MPETHEYDVVVIGAGGAGLRAAIEAAAAGARTAVISKSLPGKAQTVMGASLSAVLRTAEPGDDWTVHFSDTMRGGGMLNNARMVEILAKEAPERVLELETWGALFDRARDGRISQAVASGHTYPRQVRVGDRTGIEIMRVLQEQAVAGGVDVFSECAILQLLKDGGRVVGACGYRRDSGDFVVFTGGAVVLATGGVGKVYQVTSNFYDAMGDGHALALQAGADLIDMEFVQFHPTGMVTPPGVSGLLVAESIRGYGGVLRNAAGERFMFRYVPPSVRAQYAEDEDEADRWCDDGREGRRPPELLPRDLVTQAINAEIAAGRGGPHGGVILDIASRRDAGFIRRRLPRMYQQFKELAAVDITREPMEVAPTCHYVMGGVRVDPDTAGSSVPGLFAAGEVAAGLHGANRLNGNGIAELLAFGRRAGVAAAEHASRHRRGVTDSEAVAAIEHGARVPLERSGSEDPYAIHRDLQACMQRHVGVRRSEATLGVALGEIAVLRERSGQIAVGGGRVFNPAWHRTLDLGFALAAAEAITRSALERRESRGAHLREDYPEADKQFAEVNVVIRQGQGGFEIALEPLPVMPDELRRVLGERGLEA